MSSSWWTGAGIVAVSILVGGTSGRAAAQSEVDGPRRWQVAAELQIAKLEEASGTSAGVRGSASFAVIEQLGVVLGVRGIPESLGESDWVYWEISAGVEGRWKPARRWTVLGQAELFNGGVLFSVGDGGQVESGFGYTLGAGASLEVTSMLGIRAIVSRSAIVSDSDGNTLAEIAWRAIGVGAAISW